jgi:hypothetical protein
MAKSFIHSDCGKKKARHAQIDVETIPSEHAARRVDLDRRERRRGGRL